MLPKRRPKKKVTGADVMVPEEGYITQNLAVKALHKEVKDLPIISIRG